MYFEAKSSRIMIRALLSVFPLLISTGSLIAGESSVKESALFRALTGANPARLIAYAPAKLDPRQEANQRALSTSSIRADLEAIRPAFDGLVLYGYNEGNTPRILALAKSLKFRVVILGIWDPKSAAEIDGVAESARLYEKDVALGVLVGNEGIQFGRYEPEDLTLAEIRLRAKLPKGIPIGTSEPLGQYKKKDALVRKFGDFLAPNIHPVFDRPDLKPVDAAAWARLEALALAKETKMPVILKETGVPHAGKFQFTLDAQKEFWAAYVKPGIVLKLKDDGVWIFYGVVFEAFDLPWKSEASGLPIEKSWGLYSNDRQPYPAVSVWKTIPRDFSTR